MKASDLIEILLRYPDAEINIPSLSEYSGYTTLLREDLRLVEDFQGKTLILINNDRTITDDT